MVAIVAIVVGSTLRDRSDAEPFTPPSAAPMEDSEDGIPFVEDLRSHPAFDEAYATVCGQTLTGLDGIFAAEGSPDLISIIMIEQDALEQRVESVYARQDLWDATDPLVLEYAEIVMDDLDAILDGTDVGLEYLSGDVVLFRSLCEDWYAPT